MHCIKNCTKDRARSDFLSTTLKIVAILKNFMTDFELRKHKTAFKPLKKLGHDFKKPKDWPTKEQL